MPTWIATGSALNKANGSAEQVARHYAYIHRLKRRMEAAGFPQTDPLYRAVCDVEKPMHVLRVKSHYFSCGSGVGGAGF
jgi:hypothetical protein